MTNKQSPVVSLLVHFSRVYKLRRMANRKFPQHHKTAFKADLHQIVFVQPYHLDGINMLMNLQRSSGTFELRRFDFQPTTVTGPEYGQVPKIFTLGSFHGYQNK